MMWRVRGRTQLTVISLTVATLILILYRMSANDVAESSITKESRVHLTSMNTVNALSTVTHRSEQIAKQQEYEARIMADIRGREGYEDDRLGRRLMFPNDNGVPSGGNRADKLKEDSGRSWNSGVHPFNGHRLVHLDLKGAPPRVSYYEDFFPLIHNLGATGILMEYEDMFPFSGPQLQDLPAYNAYSKSDIQHILQLATNNGLEIIPLIQTFGHLEFLLKLEKYTELREMHKYPQVICPTHNSTFDLLTAMIDQVVTMHPGIKYLHIGCDEVYYLGECVRCGMNMVAHQWSKKQLFLHHVSRLAKYVQDRHPGVMTLTWDDEFRELTAPELVEWGISKLLEPVIWKYTPDVPSYITPEVLDKYATVFPAVWIASAFKGATGSDKYITDISYHLENHQSWMDIISSYSSQLKFKGIFITGWQRYDHFAVLCELLPVGIPSLAASLAFIQSGNRGTALIPRQVLDILKCDGSIPMSPGVGRTRCNFPGAAVLEAVERLYTLHLSVDRMLADSTVKGWMTSYNIDNDFSSPSHVEHATAELDRCKMELAYIEQDMRSAMSEVYDRHTIAEWVSTFLRPLDTQLHSLWDAREKLLSHTHWPKRPLDVLKPSVAHNW